MQNSDRTTLVQEEDAMNRTYHSTENEPDPKELNEILTDVGFGPAQLIYWTAVGLINSAEWGELGIIAIIMPSLCKEWELTSTFEAFITLSLFGSYALFSIVFGKIADQHGRKDIMVLATLLLATSAVGAALSPNKWVFVATRLVTGASLGINMGAAVGYATEFAESKYRALGMTVMNMLGYAGVIMASVVAYFTRGLFGWRLLIIITALPILLGLVLVVMMPGSPRYLCVSGQQEKAMEALKFMAKLNGRKLPENVKIMCYQDEALGTYKQLFAKEHRKSTICVSIIYAANIFVMYAFIIFTPLLFSSHYCGAGSIPLHKCEPLNKDELFKIMITHCIAPVGTVASFASAELIGRLWSLRVGTGFLLIVLGGLFICVSNFVTFISVVIANIVIDYNNQACWIVIPEVYPTTIRSTGTGFINACGKIGGVLGSACVYLLFYRSPYYVLGLFTIGSIAGFIATLVYDRETKDILLQEV